ncbi:MAG: sigma-70 family RNA polymerase sigma factor [Planctomycetota bacterium]
MEKPVAHEPDLLLARSALAGSREAQDQLIRRMKCIPAILGRKNKRLPYPFTGEELKDLAQDVFATVWEKLDSFSGHGCIEAWVYRFCHNLIMNAQQSRWRRQQKQRRLPETEPGIVAAKAANFGDRMALHEAMDTLCPEEAEVIQLKHFEGLSFTEMAERIRISSNSAKTRYYRGLKKLEHKLSPLFQEKDS